MLAAYQEVKVPSFFNSEFYQVSTCFTVIQYHKRVAFSNTPIDASRKFVFGKKSFVPFYWDGTKCVVSNLKLIDNYPLDYTNKVWVPYVMNVVGQSLLIFFLACSPDERGGMN